MALMKLTKRMIPVAIGVGGAALAVALLAAPSAPAHSRSYTDGYAYGISLYRSGEPLGSALCVWQAPFSATVPKGDNRAQFSYACAVGFSDG